MAISGTFFGALASGGHKLRVDWSAVQNVSSNTSKITTVMYLVQGLSWSLGIDSRNDNATVIDGTSYPWTSPPIHNSGGKTTKLASVTSGDIAHNADGTKTVTITATFEINATISGTYKDVITASATITLDTIPRATQPSLSASSVAMGDTVIVSMPRASDSFTHDLAYKLTNGGYTTVATGCGTSYSWTVPDVASQLPSATSGQLTLRCITRNGNTTVGTKYTYLLAQVPASVVPPPPTLSISEGTAGLAAQFGAYVQDKSKLVVSVSATGIKGSTVATIQTTLQGKTYTGDSFTSDVITTSGTVTLTTKVKDSRGRWSAEKITTVNVLTYNPPAIQTLRVYRVGSTGVADEQGDHIRVDYKYSVANLDSKNTAALVIEYKHSTETTWSQLLTGTALSADTTAKPADLIFSTDYQYDVRLTVTDWFNASSSYTSTLPPGAVILDLLANGKGLSIGKVAEQEGLDIGWSLAGSTMAEYTGAVKMGGLLIQWGAVSIAPSAANTAATQALTYSQAYSTTPLTFVTVVATAPQNCFCGVADRTVTGCSIVLTRTDKTPTTIHWLAVGQA